jgi:putative permease
MTQVDRISYKRIAGYTALVLATLTVVYVLYRLNQVVLLFVLSIILAAALRGPMLALQRRNLPRSAAIGLLYLLVIGMIGLGIYLLGEPLAAELRRAGNRFPALYDQVIRQWEASDGQWQQSIAMQLPSTQEIIGSVGERGPQVAYQIVGWSYGLANVLISLLAILTLTFYWLIDEDRFVRLWLLLLPVQQRMVARTTWYDIERRVGTFVRSEAIQFVLTLLLLWLGLSVLGVRYPVSWALYGAIAQLIPWVGIPLTLLPALPMLLFDAPQMALGAIVLIVAVGVFMDRVLEPRLGVQGIVHPIVSVLALMIMGEAAGLMGMLVALPLAATLQSILSRLVQTSTAPRPATQSIYATQVQDLRARILKLQQALLPTVENRAALEGMVRRVEELLDETEETVKQRASESEQRRMGNGDETRSRVPAIFARGRTR